MNKHILTKFLLFFGLYTFFSCEQHHIFFTISREPPPQNALIRGSPTNIVVFNGNMYVASDKLFRYNGTRWSAYWEPPENERITALAATNDYLYILSIADDAENRRILSSLRRAGSDGHISHVQASAEGDYALLQGIFADPSSSRLFASAKHTNSDLYAIKFLDSNADPAWITLRENTAKLSGAIYHDDFHYLSTSTRGTASSNDTNGGIFRITESEIAAGENIPVTHLPDSSAIIGGFSRNYNRVFMGMIKLEDGMIIAVEQEGGTIFQVQRDSFIRLMHNAPHVNTAMALNINNAGALGNITATGAIALWEGEHGDPNNPDNIITSKALVVGLQERLNINSHNFGYVEFELQANGSLARNIVRQDPPRITVHYDSDRYRATIEKHPIMHLLQTPRSIDPNMTFFASTQNEGLWSYRNLVDYGGWQWNAETE